MFITHIISLDRHEYKLQLEWLAEAYNHKVTISVFLDTSTAMCANLGRVAEANARISFHGGA